MAKLRLASFDLCIRCKYHAGIGSQPGRDQTEAGQNHNITCHYLKNTGHSRVFEHGQLAYDPAYCDKFEEGKPHNIGWTADSIGIYFEEDEEVREIRRKLNEDGY